MSLRFKQFILAEAAAIPFEKNPSIGFWKDSDHQIVYHGTHDKNVASVLKNGLDRKDPKTGMISVTHDPHTAHGYAAMSGAGGEAHFRDAGAKVVNTPHEDRSVIKLRIPKKWAEENMDSGLSGNSPEVKKQLQSKEHYLEWKKKNPGKGDHEYYAGSELRFKKEIPKEFIVGVMKKKPK